MRHFTDNGSSSWICFFLATYFPPSFFLIIIIFLESIKKNLQLLKKILSL